MEFEKETGKSGKSQGTLTACPKLNEKFYHSSGST